MAIQVPLFHDTCLNRNGSDPLWRYPFFARGVLTVWGGAFSFGGRRVHFVARRLGTPCRSKGLTASRFSILELSWESEESKSIIPSKICVLGPTSER
jgi:hypothetical protein